MIIDGKICFLVIIWDKCIFNIIMFFFKFFKFLWLRVFLKWLKYVIYKIMCFIYFENFVYLLDWNKGVKVLNFF